MIPNIVKGAGVTGAIKYAMGQGNDPQTGERKELVPGETARARILGGQNFGFEIDSEDRLELARKMMEFQGLKQNQGSKTRKQDIDCFHASLSWGDGQKPDEAEMRLAATEFLKSIGMERARAVFVAHDDTDHAHLHIIASRIDPETGKTLVCDNDSIKAQAWALDWEKAHGQERDPVKGQNMHALRDALDQRDPEGVLSYLTQNRPTFRSSDVNRALAYGQFGAEERAKFRGEVIGHESVVGLRVNAEAPITRYTTRRVLGSEMAVQRNAGALARDETHGAKISALDQASKKYSLTAEQDNAIRHLGQDAGFSILWGQAGTGKSHVLNAGCEAYEASGYNVVGLSHTNDVVQQMRADGFKQVGTLTSQLNAHRRGQLNWNRRTVLMVDEAAMVSTDMLAQLTGAAKQYGAKVILAGDDAQLPSIERGGMFETLRQSHGAAVLTEVMRVKQADQKQAFATMHDGKYEKALETFDKHGGLHWTGKQSEVLVKMAERYTADVKTDPNQRRFMFAYTNADVATLNSHARELHRTAGDLGKDHVLKTKHGEQTFAEGDRIQFTGNGRTREEKQSGLVNGRVGTVEDIKSMSRGRVKMTVSLDVKKGQKVQKVSFFVGDGDRGNEFDSIKHGYAGTIYRGQGKTLDVSYVAHSTHWRSSAAYVALTRHRDNVHIFASRETVKNLTTMAKGMARSDGKRAATAYIADPSQTAGLEAEIAQFDARPIKPFGMDRPGTPGSTREPGRSGDPSQAPSPIAGAAKVAEGIAQAAEKAIEGLAEGLAGLLGGGTAASAEPPAAPPPEAPKRRQSFEEFQAVERAAAQQRAAALHELSKLHGREVIDENDAKMAEEAAKRRDRERGGGQSL
jgi:hypothetical protein